MSHIQDGEILYRYCNPAAIPSDQIEIPQSIFRDVNLSCDWERHQSSPFETFHMHEGRTLVIKINVCDDIRNPKNPQKGYPVPEWGQEIVHDPVDEEDDPVHGANYSHSLIRGPKKKQVTSVIVKNSEILSKN